MPLLAFWMEQGAVSNTGVICVPFSAHGLRLFVLRRIADKQ